MIDIDALEEFPVSESIRTHEDVRREKRKTIYNRMRRSSCYKKALSYKQSLSARSTQLAQGDATFLATYKCPRCGYWHLTSQPQRKNGNR